MSSIFIFIRYFHVTLSLFVSTKTCTHSTTDSSYRDVSDLNPATIATSVPVSVPLFHHARETYRELSSSVSLLQNYCDCKIIHVLVCSFVHVHIFMHVPVFLVSCHMHTHTHIHTHTQVQENRFAPEDVGNSIRQLALSVQDTGMFGDLPRPRISDRF